MALARWCCASLTVLALGCATAESIEPDGTSGAAGSASSTGGGGGKGDNPNQGGTAGAAVGGTSSGGSAGDTGGAGGATGGVGGSGGSTNTGGTTSGGGTGGSGGACQTGQKLCGTTCLPPSPAVGCGITDNECTACPSPPPNANSVCTGVLCGFECIAGYTKQGSTCVSSGGGGSGGGGTGGAGTGGTSGGCAAPCDPTDIQAQFLCAFFCTASGKSGGLCAPVVNCCTCGS